MPSTVFFFQLSQTSFGGLTRMQFQALTIDYKTILVPVLQIREKIVFFFQLIIDYYLSF